MPHHADNIGVLNPSFSSFTTVDISNTISSDYKYRGGVLGPNGLIYFVPHSVHKIGVLNPSSSSFTTIDISNTISSGRTYEGVCARPQRPHLLCVLRCRQHWQASSWQHAACVRGGRRRAGGIELFVIASLQQALRFSNAFSNRLMETHYIFLKSKINIAES